MRKGWLPSKAWVPAVKSGSRERTRAAGARADRGEEFGSRERALLPPRPAHRVEERDGAEREARGVVLAFQLHEEGARRRPVGGHLHFRVDEDEGRERGLARRLGRARRYRVGVVRRARTEEDEERSRGGEDEARPRRLGRVGARRAPHRRALLFARGDADDGEPLLLHGLRDVVAVRPERTDGIVRHPLLIRNGVAFSHGVSENVPRGARMRGRLRHRARRSRRAPSRGRCHPPRPGCLPPPSPHECAGWSSRRGR